LDCRISCHVASHPTTLVQQANFYKGQVGTTYRYTTCSRLIGQLRGVINGVLISIDERDLEISEDRQSMLLRNFDIRYSTSLYIHIDTAKYLNFWIVIDLWTCISLFSMVHIDFTTPAVGSFNARRLLFSQSGTSPRYLTLPFLSLI
jgi:hypothetical protein